MPRPTDTETKKVAASDHKGALYVEALAERATAQHAGTAPATRRPGRIS